LTGSPRTGKCQPLTTSIELDRVFAYYGHYRIPHGQEPRLEQTANPLFLPVRSFITCCGTNQPQSHQRRGG